MTSTAAGAFSAHSRAKVIRELQLIAPDVQDVSPTLEFILFILAADQINEGDVSEQGYIRQGTTLVNINNSISTGFMNLNVNFSICSVRVSTNEQRTVLLLTIRD